MNPLFQSLLDQIRTDGLAPRFPDDVADLIELHRLADAVTGAQPSPGYLALLEPCVRVGNVVLHRPSLGVVEFIGERLPAWCPDEVDQAKALAWCLAHGREPAMSWSFAGPEEFRQTVRLWCRQVGATHAEIRTGLEKFQSLEKEAAQTSNAWTPRRQDRGWLIETLMAEYGGTPERWVWGESVEAIGLLLTNLAKRKAVENGKQGAPDPDLPGLAELRAFRVAEGKYRAKLGARGAA